MSTTAFVFVIGFGGIHFLDRMATGAWTRFRPLTSLDDDEAGRVAYELTTMPARPVLVCVLLGIVTAVSRTTRSSTADRSTSPGDR